MRIERATLEPFRLPLRKPFRTAQGILRERRGVLLRIVCEAGIVGVGEASPLEAFGTESFEAARSALEACRRSLPGMELGTELLEPSQVARGDLAGCPAAQAALTTAALDAAARSAGVSLARALGAPAESGPVPVNALLQADTPEGLASEAARAVDDGYATLKLKLGGRSCAADLDRIRAVRGAIPAQVRLRADANRAWNEADAAAMLDGLAEFDLEFVEEPLAVAGPEALARLRHRGGVAIALDESLRSEAGAERLLAADAADVWVLKPAWLGGPSAAIRIAARARDAGIGVVVTSALDAAVGRAAALHTAAALGGPYAAGLATGSLLARDLIALPGPKDGRLDLPLGPGLGVVP